MSPSQVLLILWRRIWIVALTFLAAVGVASAVLIYVPGRYDAVATASVDPGRSDPLAALGSPGPSMLAIVQGNLVALVESERVAVAVTKQLNLAADPDTQSAFRDSEAFGRVPIEIWIADQLLLSVDAKFGVDTFATGIGTGNAGLVSNVLNIKYKSNSPQRSALIANAFLAATIDAAIAMKAEAGDQTARWFEPRIGALKKDLTAARAALQEYQRQTSMLMPLAGGDSENSQLMAVTQGLSSANAALTTLQTRYDSGSQDLTNDPQDPDLQLLFNLKSKLADAIGEIELAKIQLGANNPKVVAGLASKQSIQRQMDDATQKMRDHLRNRIESTKAEIKRLEDSRDKAVREMIQVQAQRDKLAELQQDVLFKQGLLEAEEKGAAQADLQSKMTFSDITVLDKATPPMRPAFPKPLLVLGVAIGAGLAFGLILGLLAEALDRRVRFPEDLSFASSAPVLGVISYRRTAVAKRHLPLQAKAVAAR
jgi:uncharacterized protein involved in exopolysaccharide biosynthesis